MVEENTAASHSLSREVEGLKSMVSHFRTGSRVSEQDMKTSGAPAPSLAVQFPGVLGDFPLFLAAR